MNHSAHFSSGLLWNYMPSFFLTWQPKRQHLRLFDVFTHDKPHPPRTPRGLRLLSCRGVSPTHPCATGKLGRRCGGRVLPGHARRAEPSGRDGTPVLPCGRPRVRHPRPRRRDTPRMRRGGGVVADRDVRSTTARQGDLMMIGHAADTSDRTVLRESWAEPPFPPSPEPVRRVSTK